MFAFMVGLAILIALGIMLGAGPTNAITVVRASIGYRFRRFDVGRDCRDRCPPAA
jgi:hypothetical protein